MGRIFHTYLNGVCQLFITREWYLKWYYYYFVSFSTLAREALPVILVAAPILLLRYSGSNFYDLNINIDFVTSVAAAYLYNLLPIEEKNTISKMLPIQYCPEQSELGLPFLRNPPFFSYISQVLY